MKNVTLKLAVVGALLASSQAMAAFVTLPTSGTSAYTTCRTVGNFGAQTDNTYPGSSDSLCVAPLAINGSGVGVPLNLNSSPETGFTLAPATSFSSAITAFSETVGTLNERIFRDSATPTQCIYAKQIAMSASTVNDYNPQLPANQKMEVNDYAFGGYTGTVSVAYAKPSNGFGSVFRAGRTFTSVQMQPNVIGGASIATGFLALPTTAATSGTEITGVGQTAGPSGTPSGPAPGTVVPGAGQQDAPFSSNWVDFTTDVTGGVDEDGTTNPSSSTFFIKQACTATTAPQTPGNFKIRQTGQETQPWVIVTGTARAPGTSTAP